MVFHRWLIVVFVCAFFVLSVANAALFPGDRNGDFTVDLLDLLDLAEYWLDDGGLVVHLTFDETSGSIAYDSSRFVYEGTLVGDPTWNPDGLVGGSLVFDGADDYVEIEGFMGIPGSHSRTVSAWINADITTGGCIINWGQSGTPPGGKWRLFVDSGSGVLRLSVNGDYIRGTTDLRGAGWHHIAVVFESDATPELEDVTLYVDAVPEVFSSQLNMPICTMSSQNVSIGAFLQDSIPSTYFAGEIDDVRIYDRALSSADIAEISTNCSAVECPDYNESAIGNLDHAKISENWLESHGGPILISELLADNENIIEDKDGQTSDLIELYNPTDSSVNIGRWYLTDDSLSLKWQFPVDTFIGSKEYMVVFASGKDVYDPSEFHTNFKLNDAGEYLALKKSDGVTVSHAFDPDYGQQYDDISYGVYDNTLNYFTRPTPGSRNNYGFTAVSSEPIFSPDGGIIDSDVLLTLSSPSPDAQIRYTVDGSMPNLTSSLYSDPNLITSGHTTIVRARSYEPGKAPSPIVNKYFLDLGSGALDINSNLPIVIIETFGGTIPGTSSTEYLPVYSFFIDVDEFTGRSDISDSPVFAGHGGIRERGNSSTMFPKKQYAFETWDDFGDDRSVSIYDFPSESDWVIHAPYSDKTLMRNVLTYKWSSDMGWYAPRTKFVELYLNTDNGTVGHGDYRGVYVLMEKIKVDDDRVNVAEIETYDNAEPEVTGGYLFKKDRLDPGDSGFNTYNIGKLAYVDPKEEDITSAQASWLQAHVYEFENTLFGGNFADPVNGYAKYIDVDSFIDQHIMVEAMKNVDGYRLSTFYHKDRNGKITIGPVWDYNLSSGNATYSQWFPAWYSESLEWYYNAGIWEHAWYSRLMQDVEYNIRYADRWFSLRETIFSNESVIADIDYYFNLLNSEAAGRNFSEWNILNTKILGNYYYGTGSNPHTYSMEIEWFKQWLTGEGSPQPGENYDYYYSDRFGWFDNNIGYDYPPSFTIGGSNADQGDDVWAGSSLTMTRASGSGTIYYTTDGSDPRNSGGSISSSASSYSSGITLNSDVTIKARTRIGSSWSALNEASFNIVQTVYINELMADNDSIIQDPDEPGEYPDWIEIYNPGSSDVDLGDLYLTDTFNNKTKWKIPVGVIVPAGGYKLIWADNETSQGDDHAGFSLRKSGEAVGLYSKDGVTAVDTVTFGSQTSDISHGRYPDGTGGWGACSVPTPGTANSTH